MIVLGSPENTDLENLSPQLTRRGIEKAKIMGRNLRGMGQLTSKTTIVFGTSVEAVQTATIVALTYPDTPSTKSFSMLDDAVLQARIQEYGNAAGRIEFGTMIARTLGDFEADMTTGDNLVVIGNASIIKSLYAAANPTTIHDTTGTSLMAASMLQPGWAIDVTADPLAITSARPLLRD